MTEPTKSFRRIEATEPSCVDSKWIVEGESEEMRAG
jgi:hypothetical protein